jgi:hypothetical protein
MLRAEDGGVAIEDVAPGEELFLFSLLWLLYIRAD